MVACLDPSSTPTAPGALVPASDITITLTGYASGAPIGGLNITSKIINGSDPHSGGTPISEATLIVDEIKDLTCLGPNGGNPAQSVGNPVAPAGGPCENDQGTGPSSGGSWWSGSRSHLVCNDNTAPEGWGVCQITAKASGPQDTYDGSAGHPNIFLGRPSGTSAIVFKGVPIDPPGPNFVRYFRFTNIRVDAAASGIVPYPQSNLNNVIAQISFDGNGAPTLDYNSTSVASLYEGFATYGAQPDNSFLQCTYPTATLSAADVSVPLAETHGWASACGNAANCAGRASSPITIAPPSSLLASQPVIRIDEGIQTAWKARNSSEYLGGSGIVNNQSVTANCPTLGVPCFNGSADANATSNVFNYTYNSSTLPANNPADIPQNNPSIRFFTEEGYTESPSTVSYTTPITSSFSYAAGATGPGAGTADYGTRIQFTLNNPATGAVVSLPTIVVLHHANDFANGTYNASGVMVMTSVTGSGAGTFTRVPPSSALPSLAAVKLQLQNNPSLALTTGYVDLSGSSSTVTYEVLFADPFNLEIAEIYPIVYYPPSSLPSSLVNGRPAAGAAASVTGVTFAPHYATTGNQTSNPPGQVDGTPRFAQGSPAFAGLSASAALFAINACGPTIASVTPHSSPVYSGNTGVTITGLASLRPPLSCSLHPAAQRLPWTSSTTVNANKRNDTRRIVNQSGSCADRTAEWIERDFQ